MGGRHQVQLCLALLEEHFGSTVTGVAAALIREPGALPVIACRLKGKYSLTEIRKALVIMEQFNIVSFKMDASMRVQYSVNMSEILAFTKATRCCLIAKRLYNDLAETIFLDLFCNGRMTCSEVLRKVTAGGDATIDEVKTIFCRLAESQFIIRCAPVESSLRGCPQFPEIYDPFVMPDEVLADASQAVKEEETKPSRKRKAESDRDDGIYWRINWTRFDRYIRDEMVVDLVLTNISNLQATSSKLCRDALFCLLKCNEIRNSSINACTSAHIAIFDILRYAKDNELTLEKNDADWALRSLMEESTGVLKKVGDSSGGLFVVDYERAITLMCQNHIESLIREQLDTKAVRIFRLLQSKGYLEEEHIEKLTMMNAKETRQLVYALQEEGYIFVKPIGRTNDFTPARTIYLYYVNMKQTVQMLVEYTCKVLRNILVRRKHECLEHKPLTDKRLMIDSITDEIRADETKDDDTKQQEIAAVEEAYMPSGDKNKLDQFIKSRTMLKASEAEIATTLLTFTTFLNFDSRKA